MRFGLFGGARTEIGEQASDSRIYTDYIDYICEAEALGFHSVFLVEHHFTGFGQISATLNFLTYLAAKTSRIRLGTAVLVLPWHNPALLAEQAATLDLLSNGRLDLGIGKGYRWGEFHGFCMPMEDAQERYDETVEFLRKAWTSEGPLFASRQALALRGCRDRARAGAKAASAAMDRRPERALDPLGRRGRVQPAAGPGRQPRDRRREHRDLPPAIEAQGRLFDPMRVGLTRALHIATNPVEREAAHELRTKFMRNVQQLSLSPTGESPTIGRPRRAMSREEMRRGHRDATR